MKRRASAHAAVIILVLALSASAKAQAGHTIRGKVRNAAGVSVSRVAIDLQTGTGALIEQTVTNNEGDFIFSGLSETSYVVVADAPDYNSVSERVEFIKRTGADQPGETRTVEITLLPKVSAPQNRASATFVQNVPPAARSTLERALKLSKQGKPDLAQALMREAIKLFQDYFDAHFALGNELMRAGRLNDAIAELEQARRVNPKDDRVYDVFGLILMQQKKYAVAAAVFNEAARLNPRDPQTQLLRALALIEQANILTSSQARDSLAERDYALGEAENGLARAYELSGQKLAIVFLHRARIYEKRGDRARAADELEQYLREAPDANNADAIRAAIKKLRGLTG